MENSRKCMIQIIQNLDLIMLIYYFFLKIPYNCSKVVGGDGFIQFGTFRVGNVDNAHFSISSISGPNGGKTVIIFRNDGTVHPGYYILILVRIDFHSVYTL